jgi:hypothetical protein
MISTKQAGSSFDTKINGQTEQPWRRRFLLLYMMRVPLIFMAILGFLMPWGFTASMFHGVADLIERQYVEAAFLAFILISSAISMCFLVLLYGEERADGWAARPKPEERIARWTVVALYVYGMLCYVLFLFSVCSFMSTAGRVMDTGVLSFLEYSSLGFLGGVVITAIFFLAVLRLAKPDDDNALEVYSFPLFFLFRPHSEQKRDWIRSFKAGTRSDAAPHTYAAHDSRLSRFIGKYLGPGYTYSPASQHPLRIHSGFRAATIFLLFFLIVYWLSGQSTYLDLRNLKPWPSGYAPNSVLNFLLLALILWGSLLSGLTFFVDRFRVPALLVLGLGLFFVAHTGPSDHFFYTFSSRADSKLRTPAELLQSSPDAVIVVAAAGGGIQSAAWTSRVLCGLRHDFRPGGETKANEFESNVLVISGVSGGSVGTMFYLRCLEAEQGDESPADWAQNSSLEAVAWGLTHPDLLRIFFPFWSSHADRGWALERSFMKSAQFKNPNALRLADTYEHPHWPVLLLNSSDSQTGDPVIFTNSDFANHPAPDPTKPVKAKHDLHNFRDTAGVDRDVLLETAARMSAAFPYVSPEARPDSVATKNGVHLGDGGYFDNSGVFGLSEWLKEGIKGQTKKRRILFLELDAFPDSADKDIEQSKKWYYQLYSPIMTMLNVRSESQVIRDKISGEDLQSILNQNGFQTTWLLVRYEPPAEGVKQNPYANNPPLSWHLTVTEQSSINQAWKAADSTVRSKIAEFLEAPPQLPSGTCDAYQQVASGVFQRRCAAAVVP